MKYVVSRASWICDSVNVIGNGNAMAYDLADSQQQLYPPASPQSMYAIHQKVRQGLQTKGKRSALVVRAGVAMPTVAFSKAAPQYAK